MEAYIRKYKAGNRATMAKSRQKQLDRLERLTPPGSLTKPAIEFPYQGLVATQALTTEVSCRLSGTFVRTFRFNGSCR